MATSSARKLRPANEDSGCGCPPIVPPVPRDTIPAEPYLDYIFDRSRPAQHAFVLERITFTDPGLAFRSFARYRTAVMVALGWTRVFLCNAITGEPGTFLQLWRTSSSLSLDAAAIALKGQPLYRDFFARVASYSREILYPMPYDPGIAGLTAVGMEMRAQNVAQDTPEDVLLIDRITVKPGALQAFTCAKERFFIPAVKKFNWKLLAAASTLDGSPATVLQCWMLPSSNRLLQTMRAVAQDSGYQACVAPCIAHETQDLYELREGQ